ncbi:MAG TPA: hypothetical protein VK790_06910 [Solirubrobacteraceae bacterium]|nr:hypothetical protein [Solirubrobacteraceae bacterium]
MWQEAEAKRLHLLEPLLELLLLGVEHERGFDSIFEDELLEPSRQVLQQFSDLPIGQRWLCTPDHRLPFAEGDRFHFLGCAYALGELLAGGAAEPEAVGVLYQPFLLDQLPHGAGDLVALELQTPSPFADFLAFRARRQPACVLVGGGQHELPAYLFDAVAACAEGTVGRYPPDETAKARETSVDLPQVAHRLARKLTAQGPPRDAST